MPASAFWNSCPILLMQCIMLLTGLPHGTVFGEHVCSWEQQTHWDCNSLGSFGTSVCLDYPRISNSNVLLIIRLNEHRTQCIEGCHICAIDLYDLILPWVMLTWCGFTEEENNSFRRLRRSDDLMVQSPFAPSKPHTGSQFQSKAKKAAKHATPSRNDF